MPGVQSFVAQRQQGQLNSSRQILGAQHRVPVPPTRLEDAKQQPSFQRRNTKLPAGYPAGWSDTHLSKQQPVKASNVLDGFDTDPEGFDDTTTMSMGNSTQRHKGGYDCADAPNGSIAEAQVPFRSEQEQPQSSGEDEGEENHGGSAEEEVDEESDEEESIHDGILQDLNSSGFSQYVQGETSHTAQAAFQSVEATPAVYSSVALRDTFQHSQKPASPFTPKGNSANGGAADPGMNLQSADCQARGRAMKKTSAVPTQKAQDTPLDHPLTSPRLAAKHRRVSDHRKPRRQPSVNSHNAQQPMLRVRIGVAQDLMTTNVQSQANKERAMLVQNRSVDLGDADPSGDWDANVNKSHDGMGTPSFKVPQTPKRDRDLDYSPDQLSSITFQQLISEPFYFASDTARASIPEKLSDGSLSAKMDYILENLKDDNAKFIQRRAFFSSLAIEQYEECANLMIRRFGDIMAKFTDARQQRRRAAKNFEEEVEKREECVRGKTTVVDKNLGRLKRGGEEVVRGAAL